MKNHISTFSNLMLKYLVFTFLMGFGLLFFGCKSTDIIDPNSEYVMIPDVNFEKGLIYWGIDDIQDGRVLKTSVVKVTTLSISNFSKNGFIYNKVTDLTGIEGFVNLKILDCSGNDLTNLDVSKNIALTKLYCYENKLTSLNVSKNITLTNLICSNNQLINLDVSKSIALTYLHCGFNQLINLDVSKNIALIDFYCIDNKIQTICLNNLNQVKPDWQKDPTATYKVCP